MPADTSITSLFAASRSRFASRWLAAAPGRADQLVAFAGLPPVGTGVALAMGTIALVTGAIGFCPVWTLLGINTCPLNAGKKS